MREFIKLSALFCKADLTCMKIWIKIYVKRALQRRNHEKSVRDT